MNGELCAYCGAAARDPDHLTGRPRAGEPYFDQDLWVPSCRACNLVNEHAWSACGLLAVTKPLSVVRTERLALGLARLHDTGWEGPVHRGFWGGLRRLVVDLACSEEADR